MSEAPHSPASYAAFVIIKIFFSALCSQDFQPVSSQRERRSPMLKERDRQNYRSPYLNLCVFQTGKERQNDCILSGGQDPQIPYTLTSSLIRFRSVTVVIIISTGYRFQVHIDC